MKQINKLRTKLLSVMVLLVVGLSAHAQLNGTYTVYGAGANYANLQAAVNALNAGVSGPVVFKVRPGTWSDANTSIGNIGSVTGASATNTITFEAENGSAATTTITSTNSSSSSSSNHIFYFNGAKYIRVRNLTLNKSNTSYGTVVRFDGDADFNIVENCILTGASTTSTSSSMARVFGTSLASANNNIIRNNTINSGSSAIYWTGNSTSSLSADNEFSGNTLNQPYYYAIYSYYTSNQNISNNIVTRSGSGTFYGFNIYYADNAFKVDGNTFNSTSITTTHYPIYMWYCDGTATNRGSVSNNIITVASSTTSYGIYTYYSNYYSVNGNNVTLTGGGTKYPLYNYNYTSSSFQYGNDVYVNNNKFTATTTSTIQLYTHYYYNRNGQFNDNEITLNSGAGSQTIYAGYYYMYNFSMNGNKIKMIGTTGTKYLYANYYYGEQGYEFNNNDIEITTTTGTSYIYNGYYTYYNQKAMHYNNNTIKMIASSSASLYNYMGYYDYTNTALGNEMKGNNITMTTTGSAAINYMGYFFNGLDLSDNEVFVRSNSQAYGIFSYGNSSGTNPWIVKNNKITAIGGSSTVYGFYNYYSSNLDFVNNSIYASGNSTLYGYIGGYHNNGGGRFFNNTIHTQGSSTNYTFYDYVTSASQFTTIRNNVFSRSGGSAYLVYLYNPTLYDMDYNNLWANGGTLIYYGFNGSNYANIPALRAGTNQNKNSLSFDPGFMSTSTTTPDLRPNPANANSWSLNGRGVQISGNNMDVNGNARAVNTIQGVPDLGAYEFTPTATPPNCLLTPAVPTPSGTQVVTFGGDTVAVLRWGAAVPTGFAVKQYTGTNPPGITTINPTQMFYYVDFQGSGTALDYEQDLYFKEPWLGSIASKSALRLAEKVGSNNWTGYPPASSSANVVRNFIATPTVNDLQSLYTGIDIGNNASADAIIEPVPPFCPGTYAVKLRIKNNGNNILNNVKIDWQLNGGAITTINYTTPININGSVQGNEAIIPLGNIAFGSSAVNIKAWTYQPNGVLDPIPGDDTLNKDYFAALNGTYTVGGTNPNFPTVVAAATALTQYGTCGDVIFDIRPGVYTGQVMINNPLRVPNTGGRVTFRSENGNASSVTITHNTSSTDYPVIQLNSASGFTFKNLTVSTAASYGHCISFAAACNNDSVVGCTLNAPLTLSATYNNCIMAYGSYNGFNGDNLVIKDNKMNGGYYSVWVFPSSYKSGIVIDNNEILGSLYMGMYIYNTYGVKVTRNTIAASPTANAYYGMYNFYCYQSPDISNNKVSGFYGMGMYVYYPQGTSVNRARIVNNSVIMKNSTLCYYGLYSYYPLYADYYNNTIVNNGTSSTSYYGAYIYIGTNAGNKLYNNVFANLSGGYAAYVYINSGYGSDMDYNNLYSNGTSVFMAGTSTATSLAAWRSATSFDKHSVTYHPAITSATNPAPDVQNPGVWALNGHGVHIAGNTSDINGNTRIDVRADGVPDIGAYEIVPEVAPPVATANPASADPGDTQVFTFAGNEVGRIKWGMKAPTAVVEVRQYSGEKGNGAAAAAAPSGSMYFHTDVNPLGTGTTFDFDINVDYMNIWLGDIASPSDLRLAHRVTGFPWMVYSGSLSSVDTTSKNVDGTQLNRFGSFTALENNSVASSFVRAQGSTIICIGNNVQLEAEPKDGDYYKWYRNGVAIPGAEGISVKNYTASQAGDYSVAITFIKNGNSKVVESVPVTVSTIAPPNALVSANRPLTYCVGNGLTLDAGNTTGVSYQWQLNGNDIPGATGSSYAVSQAGNYTVVAKNVGCATVSAVTPVTNGPLSVSLGNDTSYCEIKNVWMKLDAGYPGAKYLWSTGDTSKEIEVKQGGDYWVEVDGGPNCVGTDTIEVTIDPLPKANGISFVQNGNSYQFYPSGPIGASGFLWLFSDGTSSTQNNPTKVITGDLYVRLVMFNACGSDTVQLGWPLTVSSISTEGDVQLYPNPAKERVTIMSSAISMESVEVVNSLGSVVYRGVVNGNSHSVELSSYAAGHYLIRATTAEGIITKQFDVIK